MSKELNALSPFELKDELIRRAQSRQGQMMLNAGRGNPNFLATRPRHAFLRIGDFALKEAERSYAYLSSGFGGVPEKKGIVNRFDTYAMSNEGTLGINFIKSALAFCHDHLGISKEDILHEMTQAYLGCNYPVPPRMLELSETIVKTYLSVELCGTKIRSDEFDIFATEGGTAAMAYLFRSFQANGLLKQGDKVALITPIFSPYLEIPILPSYGLEIIHIKAVENDGWQVPQHELNKLLDKEIKLLFMVNPSNPPSVKMNDGFLNQLVDLLIGRRSDLMIVTDDVYATFADNFHSVFAVCPYNTICVYSFSKYFGATGWRIGTIMAHKNNIFDAKLAALSKGEKKHLDKRYSSLTDQPRKLKFIDRLVADSRVVALNHTAGLSLPQQLQMTLFALSNLLDENQNYKAEAKRLIQRRHDILYRSIGLVPENDENSVDYYTLVDLEKLSKSLHGENFAKWFIGKTNGAQFVLRLADETGVVLLPGKGFDDDHPSARVSLANLTEYNYRAIGQSVRKVIDEFKVKYDQENCAD
ncbi:MAG: bifunctional aspartate transaminase/aspartate 4-decarboxylase [Desulfobacteraceae bacterium]|nr:bifunctional aspartate transaminase/aspartate 4-decarboxylase [Desulfobacteraceae bacterium]